MTPLPVDTPLDLKRGQMPPMTDILDIDGIFSFPHQKFLMALLFILLISSIILLFFLVIRRFLKSRARGDKALLPHERAFLEMEQLDKQGLMERGEFRKYSFFASEIYRRYVEEQFHYPALEKTTPEFIFDLTRQSFLTPPFDKEAKKILLEVDSIKFAGVIPTMDDMRRTKDRIINFIRMTIPTEAQKDIEKLAAPLKQVSP